MRSYFCGWYYRCQSEQQTLAVIPSVHRTRESKFCAIQMITDIQSFHIPYRYSDFYKKDKYFDKPCIKKEITDDPSLNIYHHTRFSLL